MKTYNVRAWQRGFRLGILDRSVFFVCYYLSSEGEGHIQSIILFAVLLVIAFQPFPVAFLEDLLPANRKLLEDIRNILKPKSDKASAKYKEENIHG